MSTNLAVSLPFLLLCISFLHANATSPDVSKLRTEVDELRSKFDEIQKQLNNMDQPTGFGKDAEEEDSSTDQTVINDPVKRKNAFVRFGRSDAGIKSKQNSFVRFGRPGAFLKGGAQPELIEKRKNAFVRFGRKDEEQCKKSEKEEILKVL